MTDTLEMNKWNEAALLDRIIVWDRWIEKGIAPEGTKETRDAAMQIIMERVNRLRAERDHLQSSLDQFFRSLRLSESQCENELEKAIAERDRLRDARRKLLRRDERNTCQHEETYRGGTLWTICYECGERWSDDEGGKPEWSDPPEWTEASALLKEMGQ